MERLSATDPIFGTLPDNVGNRTLRWLDLAIDAAMALALRSGRSGHLFRLRCPHAPHFPPSRRVYEHAFDDVKAPRTPNYNAVVRQGGAAKTTWSIAACWEDQHFRDRWRSLLSVDDLIRDVYDKLEARGVPNSTFIPLGLTTGTNKASGASAPPSSTCTRPTSAPSSCADPRRARGQFHDSDPGNVDVMPTMRSGRGQRVSASGRPRWAQHGLVHGGRDRR